MVVILCPCFALHFWEMVIVDGVIDLEVSNPTKTSGDDAVEDGMGTSIAYFTKGK